jgi:hypothetical protein
MDRAAVLGTDAFARISDVDFATGEVEFVD